LCKCGISIRADTWFIIFFWSADRALGAFLLAFGARHRLMALLAPAAWGIGSAMILDEVT